MSLLLLFNSVPSSPLLFLSRSSSEVYRAVSSLRAALEVSKVSCANRERESSDVSRLWVRRREEVTSLVAVSSRSDCVRFELLLRGPRRLTNRAARVVGSSRLGKSFRAGEDEAVAAA